MIAAFQGRCPTCGHDSTRDMEEYRKWFESRVHLEDGCEVGVGWKASPQPDASQVGMSEANAPTPLSDDAVALRHLKTLIAGWDAAEPHVNAVMAANWARTRIGYTGPADFANALEAARSFLQAIEGEGTP